MLRSMTGFGASSSAEEGDDLRIELRSVNHRHLQVKVRVPPELSTLEHELERSARKRVARGALSVQVSWERAPGAAAAEIDAGVARRYRDELVALCATLGIGEPPALATILALPGVVRTAERAAVPSRAFERRILALLDQALDALVAMREREGAALEAAMRKELALLEVLVGRIGKRMPGVVRRHQKELLGRVDELLGSRAAVVRSEDVAREVALLADRLDVAEELSRLASHLEQLRALLDKGGAVGRHMDFLVQEIFREVNTVGAKCSDAKVAHWIVDAKTRVERLREQLQNVE